MLANNEELNWKKLARYAITLQYYDFTSVHRNGAQHGNVDAVSSIRHNPDLGEGDSSHNEATQASCCPLPSKSGVPMLCPTAMNNS
jgi:hypothetical protein